MIQGAGGEDRSQSGKRRYRRFNLQCPVRVKLYSGNSSAEFETLSENVSIGGLLLRSHSPIPPQTSVSFRMTFCGGKIVRPIIMSGEGHVVRLEKTTGELPFAIAVQCNAPIAHIDRLSPAS